MSEKFRRVAPPNESTLIRRIEALEADLRTARAARRLQASTIGQGGIVVNDGGSIKVEDGGGVEIASGGGVEVSSGGGILVTDGGGVTVRDGGDITVEDEGSLALVGGQISGFRTNFESAFDLSIYNPPLVNATSFGLYQPGSGTPILYVTSHGPGNISRAVVDVAGDLELRGGAVYLGHATTGSGANARLEVDGRVYRSTSSLRYKRDVEDAVVDPAAVLALRGRTFRGRAEVDEKGEDAPRHVGFVAEELHELGLTDFVDYDDEGRPDAIQYDRLSVALLALAQSQAERLDALEARLAALEAKDSPA